MGAWLAPRRNKRGCIALAAVVLASAALGAREFTERYPNQGVLSPDRLGDSAAILLGTDIRLGRYQPEPVLVVPRESVRRAAYPVIDIHWHLESQIPAITPERLIQAMDAAGVAKIADLGGLPQMFKQAASTFAARYPDRFILFVKPDWAAAVADPTVSKQESPRRSVDGGGRTLGAQGVKISKSLGMDQFDHDGRLLAVDDPRLDPIWT